jgi:16S rRNA processing protein RimM
MLSEYIMIGQVLKPQGIKGLVKILPLTDNPGRFLSLNQVFIKKSENYTPIQVSDVKVNGEFVYCSLGAASREEAETQRDMQLYVDRANAVKIPEGANFICDLIDCGVYGCGGRYLGKVTDVLSTGANDVYVIETATGKMLVPALKHVITSIDILAKKILVDEERLLEVAVIED